MPTETSQPWPRSILSKGRVILGCAVGVVLAGWIWFFTSPSAEPVIDSEIDPAAMIASVPPPVGAATTASQGFLYGRVSRVGGETYEGRLRWGGDEEALWGHYFNGFKAENRWKNHLPIARTKQRRPVAIFGITIAQREREVDLGRPFLARFGDIARIDADPVNVWVTLKSGSRFRLDRHEASDLDDGLRIWDGLRGVVDLGARQIRSVELRPASGPSVASRPLHGTVQTHHGSFTGTVQWNRQECLGSDELDGRTSDGDVRLRFETLRSIERGADGATVTLLDGREVVLSGRREVGDGHRGIYVDDRRYGRVLVSWGVFDRIDFSPAADGPTYQDFPAGVPLEGRVATRDGQHIAGRLVFDLDESESIETLDAPWQGVDYTIPFGLIAAIQPSISTEDANVTLHSGEELRLERAGDLGDRNAGVLVFAADQEGPTYVPWSAVEAIELDRPATMYPSGLAQMEPLP